MKLRTSPATIAGYALVAVLLTAGAAQSLSGSNTVASDDIVDGQVYSADIHDGTITGTDIRNSTITTSKILNGSLTGADIKAGSVPTSALSTAPITGFTHGYSQITLPQTGLPDDVDGTAMCPAGSTPISGGWFPDGGYTNEQIDVQASAAIVGSNGWHFTFVVPPQTMAAGAKLNLDVLCATH